PARDPASGPGGAPPGRKCWRGLALWRRTGRHPLAADRLRAPGKDSSVVFVENGRKVATLAVKKGEGPRGNTPTPPPNTERGRPRGGRAGARPRAASPAPGRAARPRRRTLPSPPTRKASGDGHRAPPPARLLRHRRPLLGGRLRGPDRRQPRRRGALRRMVAV